MTTTPGEPFPAGASRPPEPGAELSPAEPPVMSSAEPLVPSADPPTRAPLPRRQPLSLGEEEVPMERLHTEHGRSGTTNTERKIWSDVELDAWLKILDATQLMALLAGDELPSRVRAWIETSEAHHTAEGNLGLRPSEWMKPFVSARLQQLMEAARAPKPRSADTAGMTRHIPRHAAEDPEERMSHTRHGLRDAEHNVLGSLEVVEETEGGGTVYRRRSPGEAPPRKDG